MIETKEWTWIDKSDWPRGEWDDEPDKMQWQDEATGLACLIVRQERSGHLCGYVGVPESHSYHGRNYHDLDFDVHGGGLTFSEPCAEDKEHGICHAATEEVWWLGFDCAHNGDLSGMAYPVAYHKLLADAGVGKKLFYPFSDEQYRAVAYVQLECASLARQLAEL